MESLVSDLLDLKYDNERKDIVYAPDTVEKYHVPYFTIDNIPGLDNIPLFKYYNLNDQARVGAILKSDHNILTFVSLFYSNRAKFCQMISRLTNFVRLFSLDIIKDKLAPNIIEDLEHFIFVSSCQTKSESDVIDIQFWKEMMDNGDMANILFWSYYGDDGGRSTDIDKGVNFWKENKSKIYNHFGITENPENIVLLYLTMANVYSHDEILKNIYLAVSDQKNSGIYLSKVESLIDIEESLSEGGTWATDSNDTHLVAHHIFKNKFSDIIDMEAHTIKIRDKLYYNYKTKLYNYTFEADGSHPNILYKMAILTLMHKSVNEIRDIIYNSGLNSIPELSKPDLIYLCLFLKVPDDNNDVKTRADLFISKSMADKIKYLDDNIKNIKDYNNILTETGTKWKTNLVYSDADQPVPHCAIEKDIVIKFGPLQLTIPKLNDFSFPSILDYQRHFNIIDINADQIYRLILDLYINLHIVENKVYRKFIDELEKL
jgi:hypothetical protein